MPEDDAVEAAAQLPEAGGREGTVLFPFIFAPAALLRRPEASMAVGSEAAPPVRDIEGDVERGLA